MNVFVNVQPRLLSYKYVICIQLYNCTDIDIFTFYYTADEVVSVNGTSISVEVPDVTNSEVKLCISFNSSSSSDRIVVLAHHINNPRKLSAYYLNASNCTEAPAAGDYSIGVFNQTGGRILKPPATHPNITVLISEY